MRWPPLLRGATGLTVLVIAAVTWTVYRAVRQADDSTEWVTRSQNVLAELDTVLGALATAEHALVDTPSAANPRAAGILVQAERDAAASVDRAAMLTADNPHQQQRVGPLREAIARGLASLRTRADARSGVADAGRREAADAARTDMDAARSILAAMRAEETGLLRDRAQADQTAVHRLQRIAAGVGIASVGLVTLVLWFFWRDMEGRQRRADELFHDKAQLEVRVDEQSAHLRATATRLQSVIDSAVDGIVVIDAKGRIEAFNRGAERLFGYAASETVGQNVNLLMPSPHHEEHDAYLARYLRTGDAKVIGIGRQVDGRRKDGTTFPLHLSVGEMTIDGDRKFTGILQDLSLRVQMEEQLREQASLVRLGEMAAVLAHEIKNPLAGIRGAIQVIGSRLPADRREVGIVKEIVSRIDALNALMEDLLLFARPPQPRPSVVELGSLVSLTADILSNDPALSDLRVTLYGTVPPVQADPDLLKIVFTNLLVNSAHAMGGRGTIRVSLAVVGNACQIDFIDSGPGIPEDVREKIFTPFFTTKSRGSGLGLPTAKRLIEAHRGNITIACPPGGGTIVSIQLPAIVSGV